MYHVIYNLSENSFCLHDCKQVLVRVWKSLNVYNDYSMQCVCSYVVRCTFIQRITEAEPSYVPVNIHMFYTNFFFIIFYWLSPLYNFKRVSIHTQETSSHCLYQQQVHCTCQRDCSLLPILIMWQENFNCI